MQGYPSFNFPTFHKAAKYLRSMGHTVFNPAEQDIERHGGVDISQGNTKGNVKQAEKKHGFSLRTALAEDMAFLCLEADMIALLPGWENSKGAFAEWAVARALGHEIYYMTS